jgi:DNA-binding transcriptional LysR family regulator
LIGIQVMPLAHLQALDMNLLLALDSLLEERSVTRAGRRLGLTQPAMSRTLARLRELLDDQLLLRVGNELVVTPRAEALRAPLRDALLRLDAVIGKAPGFEPARARRTFHLATVDYFIAVALPTLLARLSEVAPYVDLNVHQLSEGVDEALAGGAVDVVVSRRRSAAPGMVWTPLFSEQFACVVRQPHPQIKAQLSLDQYCRASHVIVSSEKLAGPGLVDLALARRGLDRRIALRVPAFLLASVVASESDMIATLGERLARQCVARFPLRVFEPPLPLPSFSVAVGWHERMRHDPGHIWFRKLLAEVAHAL